MKIATWNVNGIRARQGQVLDWLDTEQPDVVCLQEIKASPDQLPFELRDVQDYWSYWHGEKGYSGVGLLIRKGLVGALPACSHPGFDFEQRIACATVPTPLGDVMVASIYVPNGGKDFDAKMRFLDALQVYTSGGPPGASRINILRAGAICGEPGLFADGTRGANVEAMTPCVVFALRLPRFEELAARVPGVAIEVLRAAGAVMGQRMRANLAKQVPSA